MNGEVSERVCTNEESENQSLSIVVVLQTTLTNFFSFLSQQSRNGNREKVLAPTLQAKGRRRRVLCQPHVHRRKGWRAILDVGEAAAKGSLRQRTRAGDRSAFVRGANILEKIRRKNGGSWGGEAEKIYY